MKDKWIIYAYVSLVASWLIVSIVKMYPSVILEIYELASAEEYSYIYALAIVILFIFIKRINTIEPPRTNSIIYGISLASLALTSSLYFYSISFGIAEWYWIRIIALAFWIIGITLLALGLDNASKLKIPLLSLFLLIPIPRTIMDSTAIVLSKILGRIAAPIVGAKISESATGLTVLSVMGPNGKPIHFEIAVGCSGIVSLTSIIAVLPIIADILATTHTTLRRKIYALIVSVTSLTIIMLFGNLLRIIGILLAAKYMGHQAAMEFFHSTPSIIFAIVASILVVLILNKILSRYKSKPIENIHNYSSIRVEDKHPYKNMALSLILTVLVVVSLYNVNIINLVRPGEQHVSQNNIVNVNTLFQNISFYIAHNTSIKFKGYVERKDWERLLGLPLILVMQVQFHKKNMLMYIEASGSPHLFHSWPVCLAYQGYSIDKSWIDIIKVDNKTIEIIFVTYRRGNILYIMGYTKIAVMADYGGILGPAYYKITLLSSSSLRNYNAIYDYYGIILDAMKTYIEFLDNKTSIITVEPEKEYHLLEVNPIIIALVSSIVVNIVLFTILLYYAAKTGEFSLKRVRGSQ